MNLILRIDVGKWHVLKHSSIFIETGVKTAKLVTFVLYTTIIPGRVGLDATWVLVIILAVKVLYPF